MLAAAGIDCSKGHAFDVGPDPSALQAAMQRPGPLRELLAYGNTPQPPPANDAHQHQPPRPLPPPRPPQLQPQAPQSHACADAAAAHAAPAPAADLQSFLSSTAAAADMMALHQGAKPAAPPEISMQEAGNRASSPGIYCVAEKADLNGTPDGCAAAQHSGHLPPGDAWQLAFAV
jgi:hypothetical protein